MLPIDAQGELIDITSIRNGPGTTFVEIATIHQGTDIHIIGASTDILWYLIIYDDSQGLTIKGWVSADTINIYLQTSTPLASSTSRLQLATITQTSGTFIPSPSVYTLLSPNTPTSTNTGTSTPQPTQGITKKTQRPTLVPNPTLTPHATTIVINPPTSTRNPTATNQPIPIHRTIRPDD